MFYRSSSGFPLFHFTGYIMDVWILFERGTEVQGYRDIEVRKCRGIEAQGYGGTGV